jgi:hypothetical protein
VSFFGRCSFVRVFPEETVLVEGSRNTSNAYSRSHVDLYCGFLGHFIPSLYLDRSIDGTNDAISVV